MCGIFATLNNTLATEELVKLVEELSARLTHRGPDGYIKYIYESYRLGMAFACSHIITVILP